MKAVYLEVKEEDLGRVKEEASVFIEEKDICGKLLAKTGELLDEVFFPKPNKKLIYVVPEGRVLVYLVNGFDWPGEFKGRLERAGVEVLERVLNFL